MLVPQILANGLLLGGLYACIAVGFSLVWGVTNIINMLHGSFIVVGAYAAWAWLASRHLSEPQPPKKGLTWPEV